MQVDLNTIGGADTYRTNFPGCPRKLRGEKFIFIRIARKTRFYKRFCSWCNKSMADLAENRRARFDYQVLETLEAGIELLGSEVKSVKTGKMNLGGSYALIRGGELWLLNSDIPPYQPGNTPKEYDSKRNRRLLLHKEELKSLLGRLNEKGNVLIPLRAYAKKGIIKIELGLARPQKKGDKREALKKRAVERDIQRET